MTKSIWDLEFLWGQQLTWVRKEAIWWHNQVKYTSTLLQKKNILPVIISAAHVLLKLLKQEQQQWKEFKWFKSMEKVINVKLKVKYKENWIKKKQTTSSHSKKNL